MSFATADAFRTALADWINNTEATTARLNDWISLFEAEFNRKIRIKGMEATMTTTALSSGAASLPTGFLAWKELRFDGARDYTLKPKSLEWIRAQDDTSTGDAMYFAITSTQVVCWPPAGSIKGTYFKSLTSLSGLTSTTNWLLTASPDLYLAGALTEAYVFFNDEEKASMWRGRAKAIMDDMEKGDQRDDFDGGPLAMRAQ
jgi:hypothetical protein